MASMSFAQRKDYSTEGGKYALLLGLFLNAEVVRYKQERIEKIKGLEQKATVFHIESSIRHRRSCF